MNRVIINIILLFIALVLLITDALALHDIIEGEPDILYEVAMITVSILIFIAIAVYVKQRNQKSNQLL